MAFRECGRAATTVWLAVGLCLTAPIAETEDSDTLPTPSELKKMSLEELLDVKVALVSRRSENLSHAASSAQVITQDDMRRAGVTTIPEALRLFPNLQVARMEGREWAITARGMNSGLGNKLLVMIDGRTVYTPLFAGVWWDIQNMLLDNIERIEVISGPGGTLWGANAVNGVINIVTKSSEHTHGTYLTAAAGTYMRDMIGARQGGRIGKDWHFNAWAKRQDQLASDSGAHARGHDGWGMNQGGFRLDRPGTGRDRFAIIGGFHQGELQQPAPGDVPVDGQYLIGRWNRNFSVRNDLQVQVFFDRTYRNIETTIEEDLRILDFDVQHHFPIGSRNDITWGAGYRLMQDDVVNTENTRFLPAYRDMHLASFFAQDEVALWPERVRFTFGSKAEITEYSGLEIMPSGKLAWTPAPDQTVWGAVSRAVRAPSRIDEDYYLTLPGPEFTLTLSGGDGFESEYLTAYEAGWRAEMAGNMTASLAFFHNVYEDLRILERTTPANPLDYKVRNGTDGEVQGVELAIGWQPLEWWQLRTGGTWLREEFRLQPGRTQYPSRGPQGNDPEIHGLLQSMMDLPGGFEANVMVRYVAELPAPEVPYYASVDVNLGWHWRNLQVMVSGRDLSERRHAEFGPATGRYDIPRSALARIGVKF